VLLCSSKIILSYLNFPNIEITTLFCWEGIGGGIGDENKTDLSLKLKIDSAAKCGIQAVVLRDIR